MARTVAVINVTPQAIRYLVTEDGTAAGAVNQQNVIADMGVAGFNSDNSPLVALLLNGGVAIATQAAARVLYYSRCDTMQNVRVAAPAGATSAPVVTLEPNIQGANPGNFRLDIGCVKAANADTAVFVVEISFRHSITL